MNSLYNDRGVGNSNYTQVGPLITVAQLKETFLFGKTYFVNEEGRSISDEAIQTFINTAISHLEHDLDIAIMPRQKVEFKDFFINDYVDWGFLQLNNYPVISVDSLKVVYQRDEDDYETALDIPNTWLRLDPDTGMIRLIPNNRFPAKLQIDAGGAFFPELFNRHSSVPSLWRVEYTHGFKPGCIPHLINSTIGMLAAIYTLNVVGDLVGAGAGIAAAAISLDGLSQSISTTASAENNGFSGAIIELSRALFGDRTRGTPGQLEVLRKYYKGSMMTII